MNKIIVLSILLTLTGCGSLFKKDPLPPREVKIVTKEVAAEIYQPQLPRQIRLENINWFVINKDNIEEKIAEVESQLGGDFVVFALTPQSYENISYNLQEIRRYILEQKEIILYYRKATQLNKDRDGDGDIDSDDWTLINQDAEQHIE